MAGRSAFKHIVFWSGAGLAMAALLIWLATRPVCGLSVRDLSNGQMILETPVRPGDNLWLVFVNSVERLPVADHFVIDPGHGLRFTETIYQAPYAGYDRAEEAQLVAPGTLRISGYDRPLEKYTFFAGDLSRHMLFFNGRWVPLYTMARGGDIIEIRVTRKSRWIRLINRTKRMFSHE